jgi:hypothetical protein
VANTKECKKESHFNMTTNNEIQDSLSSLKESLSKLIEDAPEGDDSQDAFQSPSRPNLVQERHGWGMKYIEPIQPVGEQWLNAFADAADAVSKGGIVSLLGGRGQGKTRMAAEIARSGKWASDRGVSVDGRKVYQQTALYRRAMDIFLELREASKNHVKSSEKAVLDKLESFGLVVIDEFQERGETEWENRIMKNLLDRRYASNRPTIIIANMLRGDMGRALGDSVKDRVRECGTVIEFNWESFRAR